MINLKIKKNKKIKKKFLFKVFKINKMITLKSHQIKKYAIKINNKPMKIKINLDKIIIVYKAWATIFALKIIIIQYIIKITLIKKIKICRK